MSNHQNNKVIYLPKHPAPSKLFEYSKSLLKFYGYDAHPGKVAALKLDEAVVFMAPPHSP